MITLFFVELLCWNGAKLARSLINMTQLLGRALTNKKHLFFFSTNASATELKQILEAIGVRASGDCKKYLGLPIMVGKNKYNTFRRIKDRVWQRFYSWKNMLLS